MEQNKLKQRVINAAAAALADHRYASPADVLVGMGLLAPRLLKEWRNGQVEFLAKAVQGSPQKIGASLTALREWALANGLKPCEVAYTRMTRAGEVPLQFSEDAAPHIEQVFRTHYVSPALPEKKRKQLTEKVGRTSDPVVFLILRDSECAECGSELHKGGFLQMEAGEPLCLPCANMGDLEYLPAGDAAMTRRASKYSERKAVVVRFSRSRGRYERQGILVESPAVEKAEQECSDDAGDHAKARAVGTVRRQADDRDLVKKMTVEILALFPKCPQEEAAKIAAHTAARGSGRVGRSEAGRKLKEKALALAVGAAVRHNHTNYDELLASGVDRAIARQRIGPQVQELLASWG